MEETEDGDHLVMCDIVTVSKAMHWGQVIAMCVTMCVCVYYSLNKRLI